MDFYRFILKLRQYPRATLAGLFALFFIIAAIGLVVFGFAVAQHDVDERLRTEVASLNKFSAELIQTIESLRARPVDEACSPAFLSWLRRIAFLPDGVHEIIYQENGQMLCSVGAGRLDKPVPLDKPDFPVSIDGSGAIWLDRDLGAFNLPGVVGTYLGLGNFILVLPPIEPVTSIPDWMPYEIVNRSADGSVWHRRGAPALYSSVTGALDAVSWRMSYPAGFSAWGCNTPQTTCIAIVEPIRQLVMRSAPRIVLGLGFAAFLAGMATQLVFRVLKKEWSFSSRFRRCLSIETIKCHYQPLLNVHTNTYWGVEVLARWQDDDGTLVFPDAFLSIVEQWHLERQFTRYVVDRAYEELSGLNAGPEPLVVHFNIFPGDFDPDWMLDLFEDFLADSARFTVVIELIESDALPIERTRDAIARLKQVGILTFIDDFGEGYSSIGYLAELDTFGVKLDRCFGQAPEGSLMDAMLTSAIEMVSKTGQVVVVEGVETAARLASLRANKAVGVAQGYFIARPANITTLAVLLDHEASQTTPAAA